MNKPARMFLSSPHMGGGEFEFVREAFATNWIAPLGPHVDKFESEFVEKLKAESGKAENVQVSQEKTEGTERSEKPDSVSSVSSCSNQALHAAALSSGTAALHLALKLVGLTPGEEVFVSTLTFSASVNPIAYEGGRPVFIDSERASWNMDPARLEEALADRKKKGKLPRAVILVHLYGQCAELGAIAGLCERYGVPLIEDAAEALGAIYYSAEPLFVTRNSLFGETASQPLSDSGDSLPGAELAAAKPGTNNQQRISNNGISPGTVGRLGIFSFNGNKIITTSGGGMLVSHDEALIKKARFLATQARDPAPHYQHSEIGYNYRLSNVLAGIGRGQLRVLADRVNARRANCAFYEKAFADMAGISFMPEAPWNRCTRWLTCILVEPQKFGADREAIRLALEAENIEARPVWKPMHLQPVFAGCDRFGGEVAEDLFERGLCLPSGSNLSETDLQRVVEVVRGCARRR
jgi:dTDP-4-amino-4,6-dideoxygalactose transaminase